MNIPNPEFEDSGNSIRLEMVGLLAVICSMTFWGYLLTISWPYLECRIQGIPYFLCKSSVSMNQLFSWIAVNLGPLGNPSELSSILFTTRGGGHCLVKNGLENKCFLFSAENLHLLFLLLLFLGSICRSAINSATRLFSVYIF